MNGIEIINKQEILQYSVTLRNTLLIIGLLIGITTTIFICKSEWNGKKSVFKKIWSIIKSIAYGIMSILIYMFFTILIVNGFVKPTVPSGNYTYKIKITDEAKYNDVVNTYIIDEEKDGIYTVRLK